MRLMENKVKPSYEDLPMTIGMKLDILISFGATKWAQPTNPVGVCKSLTQKHVAKRYMIAEKLLPLHHESYQQYKYV